METTFFKWLAARDESASAYALRMGTNKRAVSRLAGMARIPLRVYRFDYQLLGRISADTGIPVETLAADAIEAAKSPIAPRPYTRKEKPDGKRTAAE